MTKVELRGVSKVYPGGVAAVRDLDLQINAGELLAIVGASGSGKSSVLRLIAGLEPLSGGEVRLGGQRADDWPPSRRDVAMVFQDPAPYPHLSVFENLAFGLRARRRPTSEIQARVASMADLLGLTPMLDRMPSALSGGERQRLALGRALARRPAILLLDEPFSSLDAPLRLALRAELIALHRRFGTTTIHVTHDQAEALALGDRVAVLDRGRLAQVGPPLEVYDRPASLDVARFIGSPPMNLVAGLAEIAGDRHAFRADGLGPIAGIEPPRAGPIVLGFRPEAVGLNGDWPILAEGQIGRLEPLGSETLADLEHGPIRLTARLAPDCRLEPGGAVAIRIDPSRVTWFDPLTRARIA